MATQNRHLNTPKKTTLDEAIATDIAINIIVIQHLKFFLKKTIKKCCNLLDTNRLGIPKMWNTVPQIDMEPLL